MAIRGFEAAFAEFNATFGEYLTATAGQRFDPPIQFQLKPLNFLTLFSDAQAQDVDFIYVNPSAYSCIESEYEAHSLASQVSRRNINGNIYDLKKFGGVIVTLASRDDIASILDLRNKVIAAASISGLGSGQMQFKRMVDNGMNYLQDPKQLVFTSNQGLVVKGVLNGDFDVGFVRTDQLERSKDNQGNPVDLNRFKIVSPVPNLTIDGEAFPFQSSTELYAEWNIAALTHVSPTVSREVQRAMLAIQDHAAVGRALADCEALNGTETCQNLALSEIYPGPLKCSATHEIVAKAFRAQTNGKFAGWTTSLSYMQLRSMQEATGFIRKDEDSLVWRCVRSAEMYDAITCPAGYDLKTKEEVDRGCAEVGLKCQEGFQCICRPCETPYELVCVDSVKVGEKCISLAVFLPSIIIPVLVIVGIIVHFYVEWRRRQADTLWIVKPSELTFESPPTVIGRGTFGLVLLADYRGTEVAVKRVIPADTVNRSGTAALFDASTGSASLILEQATIDADFHHGTQSFHPGMHSMAPKKLKRALLQQQAKREEREGLTDPKRGYIASILCCGSRGQRQGNDSREQLKAEFVNEIRQLARLRYVVSCKMHALCLVDFWH